MLQRIGYSTVRIKSNISNTRYRKSHTHTHTHTHTHRYRLHKTNCVFFCISLLFCVTGIYYRPSALKSMTCLLGNTENRIVFDNFELQNLNSDAQDYTHGMYQKYLETNHFIAPEQEQNYWSHTKSCVLPKTPSTAKEKGLFNIFPLCLTSDELFKTPSSNIGMYPCPPTPTPTPLSLSLLLF